MKNQKNVKWAKKEEIAIEKITENEIIVYDINKNALHVLNHTGYLILEECNGLNFNEIIENVKQKVNISEGIDINEELKSCLNNLEKARSIERI